MNENETPKPNNLVLEILVAVGETIINVTGAILAWMWEIWKMWWMIILFIGFALVVLYSITKPGWDEVAAGRSFFLSEFDARNRIVQDCLKSELEYTRAECIELAAKRGRP